jgi:fatty acid CoA ligase FadD36
VDRRRSGPTPSAPRSRDCRSSRRTQRESDGRARDDLIKSGGYRIGAGEVESALLGHPGVTEAAVIGVPDDDLGQRIVAYVVGSGVGERELIDHVASELSVHKRPREVRIVAALPRNALGKVQKAALRREYR